MFREADASAACPVNEHVLALEWLKPAVSLVGWSLAGSDSGADMAVVVSMDQWSQ